MLDSTKTINSIKIVQASGKLACTVEKAAARENQGAALRDLCKFL
jgi:hypothetical protein